MLKKTPFIIGISLIVQGFTFLILFILLITNKKSLTGACLALSAACATGGVLLAYKQLKDELDNDRVAKAMEALATLECDVPEVKPERPYIPVDDTVNEDEFK